jgi:hypothetical protein
MCTGTNNHGHQLVSLSDHPVCFSLAALRPTALVFEIEKRDLWLQLSLQNVGSGFQCWHRARDLPQSSLSNGYAM